ncbi:MAG: FlgD immunoglobulin-like domain containing protein [Gemmatimonadota bacterium]|jgi:hypothetical protein|nr:FlgD immunoglobulin-like domain containing protein [Gemmatimonadota bacterium]MDP7030876.1 FlgD immunoglobulin-like domain containing protein [Gemmatimonadota bacterium]
MTSRVVRPLLIAALLAAAAQANAQYTLYYGNFHSHCSLSDDAAGSGTPAEAFQYARDTAGIDVLALTDHTHYMSTYEYNTLRTDATTYTQNGVFVAIAAQEHGSLSTSASGAFGHMNIYDSISLIPQYDNGTDYRYNLLGTYSWIATRTDATSGAPLVGTFNHPYSTGGAGIWARFQDFTYSTTGDMGVQFIEVLNGKRSSAYEPEYFDCLSKGWHVGALGNQDNHQGEWGDQVNNVGNIPLTGIWAPALTKADILQALANRRTYAMEVDPVTDRISVEFRMDGNWMGSEYGSAADSLQVEVVVSATNPVSSINLFRNGILVKSTGTGGSPSYTWNTYDTPGPGEFSYVVRVSQADGDRAWTSPIWVSSTSSFTTPLAQVNEDDANGLPVMWFQNVMVQGIVTVDTDTLDTTDNLFYLQDDTGGVQVWEVGAQTTPVALGDNVLVSGFVNTYQGQTVIIPSSVQIQNSGATSPTPVELSTASLAAGGELYEGQLAVLRNVSTVSGSWPAADTSTVVTVDDGSGPCDLFIDGDTSWDELGAPVEPFSITGILWQEDTSMPYLSGHRLTPRYAEDIVNQTGVNDPVALPNHHSIHGTRITDNTPNPFRPATTIRFEIAGSREVAASLAVYDITGRRVRTLVQKTLPPGEFEILWNGRDSDGRKLAAGVYFARLQAEGVEDSRKMVLLK